MFRSLLGFLVLLSSSFTVPAQARLGDTERDCVVRYGSAKPVARGATIPELVPGAQHAVYEHEGWKLTVAFLNGRVVAQEYKKRPGHPNGLKLIDAEMESILKAEQGSGTWSKPHLDASQGFSGAVANALIPASRARIWDRSDGSKATLLPASFTLLLETPAAIAAKRAAAEAKAAAKRKNVPPF